MHNFKKVLLSLGCVLLAFLLLSAALLGPYLNSEMVYYQDGYLRNSLAGTLDYLVIGASNGLCAFDSRIMDSELGCTSYNLSGTLLTMNSREYFMKTEVQRNPVKTVVFDISYETLTRDEGTEYASGDAVTLSRILTPTERLKFVLRNIRFDDWSNLYSQLSVPSIEHFLTAVKGTQTCGVDYTAKGFYGREANNIELQQGDAGEKYNQNPLNTEFRDDNISKLISQINFCHDNGIHVILAVVPKSDTNLWKEHGHDLFYQWMTDFAEEHDCDFYDMNLLKDRYTLWNDRNSYFDETHMSAEGAVNFTKAFCDIVKKAETEDVSEYFYDSYEEMKADSPYMEYLK